MNNFEEDFKVGLEGGRLFDKSCNLIFPWYTRSFLKELSHWDVSQWKVFEYGCGDSTFWWRKKCKKVYSVDNNKKWSEKIGSFYCNEKEKFVNYPKGLIDDGKFDCIIIDGNPNEWRDFCTEPSLQCLKQNGIIIIDNYQQKTTNTEHYPITDKLLENKIKKVFQQKGHPDWKTAYWII